LIYGFLITVSLPAYDAGPSQCVTDQNPFPKKVDPNG
jgi:hypothetical protein